MIFMSPENMMPELAFDFLPSPQISEHHSDVGLTKKYEFS